VVTDMSLQQRRGGLVAQAELAGLPAEAAQAHVTGFGVEDEVRLALHAVVVRRAAGTRQDVGLGHRFEQAGAEHRLRGTQRDDCGTGRRRQPGLRNSTDVPSASFTVCGRSRATRTPLPQSLRCAVVVERAFICTPTP
jgi:hypothetical protein